MKKPIFTGSAVAIITPFNEDMSVNYDMLKKLIEFQICNGTSAIVVCATTGESPTLTDEEYKNVIKTTVETVNKRVPVIAGAGSNNTKKVLALCNICESCGVDALLVVTPFYNKTSQKGAIEHYTYIADRINKPLIVYNVPSRTGLNLKPETYFELSKHPMINGVKEANEDISSVSKTIALCGDNFIVYSGSDDLTLPMLSLGAAGVISVFANPFPKQISNLCKSYFDGNTKKAMQLQKEYVILMQGMFMDVNPIPVKAAMKIIGMDCGNCRMPLTTMEQNKVMDLKSMIDKIK